MKPAIQLNNLHFAYSSNQHAIIDIQDWTLSRGERVFLSGPSGSGKSTFLNLLSGMLRPQSGQICLFDVDLSTLSNAKMDAYRAQTIGMVFQQFNLVSYLSVYDNIALAAHFAGNKEADLAAKIYSLLSDLQLPSSIVNMRANQLSVGQQQRVAIARALINDAPLLVVDEPTSALDEEATDMFMQLLMQQTQRNHSAMIFVSHDPRLAKYFDRVESLQSFNTAHKVVEQQV